MSGGDNPFRTYSQLDGRFGFGYYPMPPPLSPPRFAASGSKAPPHGPPGFDLNNSFGTSGAACIDGGMAGPAHGYAGYGVQLPYYHMPYHGGRLPMPEPARHSTTSLPGFEGGPYTFYRPYGDGSSHAGRAHLSHGPPSWHPTNMGEEEMSSAAPRRRQQFFGQSSFPSPVHDVESNDHSMASVGGADDLPSASSSGDNAGIVGNAAALEQDEGKEDSMGSQREGSSSEGDLGGSSGDDSSDEEYEELYKGLEDSFGKENPVVKGIKLLSESSRNTAKLLKKAILQGMYEEFDSDDEFGSDDEFDSDVEMKESGIEFDSDV